MHSPSHRTRTLILATVLHGFTHVYQVALLPLYFLIQKDLKLTGVGQATFLVTLLMMAYFLPSYPLGALADRVSRKKLLAIGLLINAAGFVALAFAPNYGTALLCVTIAGFGGSFYHPAATAMVARLYPVGTGRALGIIGMGASVGFFVGPIYCGWRAATAGWRAPVLELGLLGIAGAIAFALLAREETAREAAAPNRHRLATLFPSAALWFFFVGAALAFSLRDFAGSGMGSLSSLFLQKAHGLDLKSTGVALSAIFIGSLVSNPLFGGLSDRGRFGWGAILLFLAATIIAIFPHLPRAVLVPTFIVYGFFFMATFPVVEAALMESVPDEVRGRVFGFFITIGGLIGNLSHWLVGKWVHGLGPSANSTSAFFRVYGVLACMVVLATLGLACLKAIRRRENLAPHDAQAVAAQPSPAQGA
jgi:MFS transporter, FSR family, fosmidomycin resistance protein